MKRTLTIFSIIFCTTAFGQSYSTFYGTYDVNQDVNVNQNVNVNKNVNVSGTVNQNVRKTSTTDLWNNNAPIHSIVNTYIG